MPRWVAIRYIQPARSVAGRSPWVITRKKLASDISSQEIRKRTPLRAASTRSMPAASPLYQRPCSRLPACPPAPPPAVPVSCSRPYGAAYTAARAVTAPTGSRKKAESPSSSSRREP